MFTQMRFSSMTVVNNARTQMRFSIMTAVSNVHTNVFSIMKVVSTAPTDAFFYHDRGL